MDGKTLVRMWLEDDKLEMEHGLLADAIDLAIAQAVEREREACALLCEETKDCENDTDYYHTSEGHVRLADAIRARTP
jgi:hypothetical protein